MNLVIKKITTIIKNVKILNKIKLKFPTKIHRPCLQLLNLQLIQDLLIFKEIINYFKAKIVIHRSLTL